MAAAFGGLAAAAGGGTPAGGGGGGGSDGAGAAAAVSGLVGRTASAKGRYTAAGPSASAAAGAAAVPRLAALPHAPAGLGGADPPPGSSLFQLRVRQTFTDRDELFFFSDDLAAHVFVNRGSLLEPYL